MSIQRATPVNEFLAKLIFLMLPTVGIGYFLLDAVNRHFSILQNQAVAQTVYYACGVGISALFYSFRFRFVPTFLMLLLAFYTFSKGLNNYSSGEFDTFFITVQFQVFAFLFTLGWLIGWGYVRYRYFAVIISLLVLTASVVSIANSDVHTVREFLFSYLPPLAFGFYNIFTAEQIYNYKDKSRRFWGFLLLRLSIFSALLAGILIATTFLFGVGMAKALAEKNGGGGKSGKNSMLKKNKDGTFDLNDYTKLSNSLDRDKQLLFCAHIDNYFPGTKVPNPLYLTAYYFTKFDTLTETFERDKVIPYNDLFLPDPSKIPLFKTVYDTNVIKNSLGDLARDIVDVEIYNCKLSPGTYIAPNVGFFVQPITIEKDFREKFISAYRTKSYVSMLNSAYFVYNSDTPAIRNFQEERFKVLRSIKEYKKVDTSFMKYYTKMPTDPKFATISALAHKITDTAKTPVDKVLAIRNYFLSKDENGQPLYVYTDNPGEPDIPSASKLMYFLNENHKGYCAYYAGATLFMLRAIGIPSRIAVGFLTEDRSDKNKGWYWYYANQAHAWNQVFFPGYGWLDFDFTVGNTNENRPTPQPDGTPPMQPPKAWLAMDGRVANVDTIKKTLQIKTRHFVFHDKEYNLDDTSVCEIDMKVATVYRDSQSVGIGAIHNGEEATVVSYAEAMKKLAAIDGEKASKLLSRFPSLVPVDEAYLKSKEAAKQKETPPQEQPPKQISRTALISISVGGTLGFILLLLSTPEILLLYYRYKHKKSPNAEQKAYWAYKLTGYYLHMIGFARGVLTPLQYANRVVDPQFNLSYGNFIVVYLKLKYAGQALNEKETLLVAQFAEPFLLGVKSRTTVGARLKGFLNIFRMMSFFALPEDFGEGDEV